MDSSAQEEKVWVNCKGLPTVPVANQSWELATVVNRDKSTDQFVVQLGFDKEKVLKVDKTLTFPCDPSHFKGYSQFFPNHLMYLIKFPLRPRRSLRDEPIARSSFAALP
jgi:hypothetical protein